MSIQMNDKNKKIVKSFCRSFIKGDVTEMVQYILDQDDARHAPFSTGDTVNYIHASCPYCRAGDIDVDMSGMDDWSADIYYVCPCCGEKLYEYQIDECVEDVGQWVQVHPKLAKKLKEYHEPIAAGEYWGRADGAVPVEKDDIIIGICDELGILSDDQ